MNPRVLLSFIGTVCALAPLAVALEVDVLEIEVSAAPGQVRPLTFLVRNETAVAEWFTLYVADWDRDEHGNNRFYPPGTLPRSLAPWLEVSPTSFRLEPGESRQVAGVVRVPAAGVSTGTYWGMVFVQGEPRPVMYQGSVVMVTKRIGIKVYLHVGGVRSAGAIRAVEPRGLNPLWIAVRFENTGAFNLKDMRAQAQVYDSTGKLVAEAVPVTFPCLPGGERWVRLDTELRVGTGTYLVVVKVELPGGSLLATQASLRVRALALAPLSGGESPRDLDGDGLYEDVNGDGSFDDNDVDLFQAQYMGAQVQANWRAFDFNNDGQVDERDVQILKGRRG